MVRINVLVPIKGPAPWLGECLASLEQQTLVDWNLVAVLHGTDEVAEQLLKTCAFPVALIRAPVSYSLSEVLNLGLKECTGEYVARLDSDDVALPERLALQSSYLDMHPEVAVVGSDAEEINESGVITGHRFMPHDPSAVTKRLVWRNALIHPTTMFRRTVVVELGGYNTECRHVEDFELWLRVQENWDLASLNTATIQYRIHSQQVTRTSSPNLTALKAVRSAQISLARARHRSATAAKVRNSIWSLKIKLTKVIDSIKY